MGTPNENTPIDRGVRLFLEDLFSIWWVYSKLVETYTRIPDMYPAGQIRLRL